MDPGVAWRPPAPEAPQAETVPPGAAHAGSGRGASLGARPRGLAPYTAARPVLMTGIFRNRATGHPWVTALLCPGWPFPSLGVPPRW